MVFLGPDVDVVIRFKLGDINHLILPLADARRDFSRIDHFRINLQFLANAFGQTLLIVLIHHAKRMLKTSIGLLKFKNAQASAMKGGNPRRFDVNQALNALFHFASRFVGEGNRQDAISANVLLNDVGNTVRNHPRLTRAGSRNDQQRTFNRSDGLALKVVHAMVDIYFHFLCPMSDVRCPISLRTRMTEISAPTFPCMTSDIGHATSE